MKFSDSPSQTVDKLTLKYLSTVIFRVSEFFISSLSDCELRRVTTSIVAFAGTVTTSSQAVPFHVLSDSPASIRVSALIKGVPSLSSDVNA